MEEKEELLEEVIIEARVSYTRPIQLKSPQMYGEDVKAVQKKLNELNYDAGTVDGYYGPTGVAAVKDFQGRNGLTVDGSVGPATWNKLFASLQMPKYKRAIQLKSPQMNGTDVKLVQKRLNNLKYNAGTVDGYYGPTGVAAVKDFQNINGLSVDGSVGPATWNKLFSSSAKPKSGTIGKQRAYEYSKAKFGDFSLRVNEGGTLYKSDYVMEGYGYYKSLGPKKWYKNDEWENGNTAEFYYGIKNINYYHFKIVNQIKEAFESALQPPYSSPDQFYEAFWKEVKKVLIEFAGGNIKSLSEDEIENIDINYIFETMDIDRDKLTDEEVKNIIKTKMPDLSDEDINNLTDEEINTYLVLPSFPAILNAMKIIETIFKGINLVITVEPSARFVYHTLKTLYHFKQI